ncbi:MAG: threonine synthase [Fidelibacterota bacterium]|nr:MAG: threonine synthase [Candidatus Neomarinimicrobiota bacterium]
MTQPEKILGFKCVHCGVEYPHEPFCYTCAACGNNLDVVYDYRLIGGHWSMEELARDTDHSLWRYLPLLPVFNVPENHSLRVGWTPLVALPGIATDFDLGGFFIKDDTRNPSGSLKDRATEVAIQHASQLGADILVAASTGNAAASLAALTAFYGRQAVILAPSSAPAAKLTQILQHGAILCPIEGSYDDAFDLAQMVVEANGWYSRSTGINPVLTEGKKTVALEIAEQLDWRVPDWIFIPVGDGCIIGGAYKGFSDLRELGWIECLPKLVAVQAEGAAAIVDAFELGKEIEPVQAATIADSIGVGKPRDGLKALRAVGNTGGFGIKVSDEEILQAQHHLATKTGIFCEPAAAAAFAGFIRCAREGRLAAGDTVVVVATGSGLKDIPAARRLLSVPEPVPPDLSAFNASYQKQIVQERS